MSYAHLGARSFLYPGARSFLYPGARSFLYPGARSFLYPGARSFLYPGARSFLLLPLQLDRIACPAYFICLFIATSCQGVPLLNRLHRRNVARRPFR
jgi:hypothetical protein